MNTSSAVPFPRHILVVACFACTASEPASRLEVEPDTLALYGRDYSWVRIRIVDHSGATTARQALLTARDTAVVRTSGTSVACLHEGTTTIDVAVKHLTASVVANCRFAARIEGETYFEFEPGDAPRSLAATAVFSSGRSEPLDPIDAKVNDTTVAIVRDGAVVPRAIGHAGLRIDYGGAWVRAGVLVRRIISDDTVSLGSGESRVWQVEPGRYTISVKVNTTRDLNILTMETASLRCSRDSRDGDMIHCVADEPAEVTLRNTSTGRPARTGRAFVRIVQVPRDRGR